REGPVQVRPDRAVRKEESIADLAIGQPLGRQLRDLELLRGQAIARVGRAGPDRLAGGTQLLASAVTPAGGSQRVEELACAPQRLPGVGRAAPATKPRAVAEKVPREQDAG